ncbi:hypothetical protein CFR73_01730 [Novacetimonas maltaceti]|nr:hypothetical protein CFR73_01730 [Novacetimonas maltaceti]
MITTCTNRKRKPVAGHMRVSSLPPAATGDLAAAWAGRLRAEKDRFPALHIYGGRLFQDAIAAAGTLGARMLVISAGLGVVDADDVVPPYGCTVLAGVADSISARATDAFSSREWWDALTRVSPFSRMLGDAVTASDGLVCAALSDAYITMVAGDLEALPEDALARLRLFTRTPSERVPLALRSCVMPYDDRLDGPDSTMRGTRSDFAGRALRHFVERIAVPDDPRPVAAHAAAVRNALSGWRLPRHVARVRHDDAELLALIRRHWAHNGGHTGRLLRFFRDELHVSCEQGRFAALARQVRAEQA